MTIGPAWDRREDTPDVWFAVSAVDAHAAEDGGFDGFGPNRVEWSAESISEAVALANVAYDAPEDTPQPDTER